MIAAIAGFTFSFVACTGEKKQQPEPEATVEGAAQKIDSAAHQTGAAVSEGATAVKDNAEEGLEHAKDKAGKVIDQTKESAEKAAEKAKSAAKDVKEDVSKAAKDVKKDVNKAVK